MTKNSSSNNKNNDSNLRNIEIAKLAYIGAAIATVADAIAMIGDGIATYAAKLTLDALLNPDEDSDGSESSNTTTSSSESTSSTESSTGALATGASAVPIDITPSSRASARLRSTQRSKANKGASDQKRAYTRATSHINEDVEELHKQIDHYINELIEIRDSLLK